MQLGPYHLPLDDGQAYIMGILNVTPDSFSDGGQWADVDRAIDHTAEMIRDGADIIDIGGESTRPGHVQISEDEEMTRILPVIEALKGRFEVPLSVDCYRAGTAKAAIDAGAHLINDIWGLTYDAAMAPLIAAHDVAVCIMHNRREATYRRYPGDVLADLNAQLDLAADAGIKYDRIIIDPGIGFAKNRAEDAALVRHLDLLKAFHLPILLGTSRKRLIGAVLDVPAIERDHGTAATTVYGYLKGAQIFRVHNVKENRQALDMALALERGHHGLH